MIELVRQFLADRRANLGVLTAVTLVPVMFLGGVALDYSQIQRERSRLQETADSAAFYAVMELERAGVSEADLKRTGYQVVQSNLMIEGEVGFHLDSENRLVRVTLSKSYQPGFIAILQPDPVHISVLSEVEYGQTRWDAKCFVALNPRSRDALRLNGNARIDAPACDLQVNSTNYNAVDLNGNASAVFRQTCILGGVDGERNITGLPDPNCGPMDDPFDEIRTPAVGECDYNNHSVQASGRVTLKPGVYCGGLEISGSSDVVLDPGLFVIKDGPLTASGSAKLSGDGVSFYFVGAEVSVEFTGGATLDIKAMSTGPLAGFVTYFDPSSGVDRVNSISGNDNLYFEGILYFGQRELEINGNGSANTSSPFSVVIADTVTLNGNAKIGMNANQSLTTLKIPDELFTKTIVPRLVR